MPRVMHAIRRGLASEAPDLALLREVKVTYGLILTYLPRGPLFRRFPKQLSSEQLRSIQNTKSSPRKR